jgi:hypothetical protein
VRLRGFRCSIIAARLASTYDLVVAERDVDAVKYPEMRMNLQYAVAALAGSEYQDREWTRWPRDDYWYDLHEASAWILDDMAVLDDAPQLIGTVLLDQAELEAVPSLGRELMRLIESVETRFEGPPGYAAARRSAAWADVVRVAGQACEVIGKPDQFP